MSDVADESDWISYRGIFYFPSARTKIFCAQNLRCSAVFTAGGPRLSESSRFAAIQHLFNNELEEWKRQAADKSRFHYAPPGLVFAPVQYKTTIPIDGWLPPKHVSELHAEIGDRSDPDWTSQFTSNLNILAVTASKDLRRVFWAFQKTCIRDNIDPALPNNFANSRIFHCHWYSLLSGIPRGAVNRLYIHHPDPKSSIFNETFPEMAADLLTNDDCFVSVVSSDQNILSRARGIFFKRPDLFTPVTEEGTDRLYPRGLPKPFPLEISRSAGVLAWRRHPLSTLPNSRFRRK